MKTQNLTIEEKLAAIASLTFEIDAHITTRAKTLDGGAVVRLYRAIASGDATRESLAAVLGVDGLSDRRADRALKVLKSRGLIAFDRAKNRWRAA